MKERKHSKVFYLVSVERIENHEEGTIHYKSVYSNGLITMTATHGIDYENMFEKSLPLILIEDTV